MAVNSYIPIETLDMVKIKKNYSFNALAEAISNVKSDTNPIDLLTVEFHFIDTVVNVDGYVQRFYKNRKLVEVDVKIDSVFVSSVNFEKIFSYNEKLKLSDKIRATIL